MMLKERNPIRSLLPSLAVSLLTDSKRLLENIRSKQIKIMKLIVRNPYIAR
jgi:hypothetical protein